MKCFFCHGKNNKIIVTNLITTKRYAAGTVHQKHPICSTCFNQGMRCTDGIKLTEEDTQRIAKALLKK